MRVDPLGDAGLASVILPNGWHHPGRLAFGMRDVDLRWIAVEEQVLHADMDELIRVPV
jgi:hypothetical protein